MGEDGDNHGALEYQDRGGEGQKGWVVGLVEEVKSGQTRFEW